MDSEPMPSVLLLAIDLQEVFLRALPEREELLRRCRFAIEAAGALEMRVCFTEQMPQKLGPVLPELAALAPAAPRFGKSGFSALDAPGLREYLRDEGIDHLVLAGVETPICLYQTALAATDDDFTVTLLTDCVGGRRPDDGAAVLRSLAAAGCHLLPAETVFYSIVRSADHPAFRSFTALVKKHSGANPTDP